MKPTLIFGTPVVEVDIPEIPQEEHDALLNEQFVLQGMPDANYQRTEDTYILNKYPILNKWINEKLSEYGKEIMACDHPLRITQSWCIRHNPGKVQRLFAHYHANSIVSGVYYVAAPPGTENIRYHRPKDSGTLTLTWETNGQTADKPWLYDFTEFTVKTGRLVLYPSHLSHSVDGIIPMQTTRQSLAFNVWFDGPFVNAEKLFELK